MSFGENDLIRYLTCTWHLARRVVIDRSGARGIGSGGIELENVRLSDADWAPRAVQRVASGVSLAAAVAPVIAVGEEAPVIRSLKWQVRAAALGANPPSRSLRGTSQMNNLGR